MTESDSTGLFGRIARLRDYFDKRRTNLILINFLKSLAISSISVALICLPLKDQEIPNKRNFKIFFVLIPLTISLLFAFLTLTYKEKSMRLSEANRINMNNINRSLRQIQGLLEESFEVYHETLHAACNAKCRLDNINFN